MAALNAEEIACVVHYPTPPHLQVAYAHLGMKRGAFPVSERIAETVLSLPMDPLMPPADTDRVAAAIKAIT
jgi:dTDP-4-amino-4,6-dideoxygalactose transaminase